MVKFKKTRALDFPDIMEAVGDLRRGFFHQFADDGKIALIEDEETGSLERVFLSAEGSEIVFETEPIPCYGVKII